MLVLEAEPPPVIIDNPRLIIGVNIELQSGTGSMRSRYMHSGSYRIL